jgi:hypothetical protein
MMSAMPTASSANPIALFITLVLKIFQTALYPLTNRKISVARNKMRKIAKRIRAIPTAAPAIPVKPNTPAMSAIIKNMTVHPSILDV